METTAAQIDGVLLHQESGPQTPVAKKTRRAVLQKQNESILNRETVPDDDELMSLPKTPSASIRKACETPRRSARKSVRPTLDYTDIIEKNLLSSASKEKKDTTIVDKENLDEEKTQKWSVAEVGRTSGKRSRKSKKTKSSKVEKEQQKRNDDEKEQKQEDEDMKEQVENKEDDEMKEQEEQNEVKTEKKELEEEDSKQLEVTEAITVSTSPNAYDENKKEKCNEEIRDKKPFEPTPVEIKVELCPDIIDNDVKSVQEQDQKIAVFKENDMDELGLCPLEAEHQPEEDDEMPSLIMIDDGDTENELNVTFDADDKAHADEVMPALCIMEEQQIDVDLKQPEAADIESDSTKPKAYRFPTPFKRKIQTEFADCEASSSGIFSENPRQRRSKSVPRSNETKAKGVTFYSPVEMANVNDIDKRWENLNNSNVTKRRKRSKSLEPNPMPSRIPKMKQYPPIKSTVTPSKLKARTKLPNFAAIHQKQFEKMENLVEHMERKAVRAKVLTSSAVKLQQQQQSERTATSAMKQTPVRLRAVKKIEVPSYSLTPLKPEEVERVKLLPTPRKIVGVTQPKSLVPARPALSSNKTVPRPAFNLSTSVTSKLFIPAVSGPGSIQSIAKVKPGDRDDTMQNKLEARRKRHMEMFKGRSGHEKRSEIVRGVRSNRRFELQMQHRRQLDENAG
ncbi:PREDICTED: FK506-binding protein 5 isoform X2 [Drosophila arizonae]|uniref:FK506-binding protein 5 isoform X2 n=1 Tax=Drosophila arizonae TaxID=7263 RepID=A0ABM1Q5K7_DROAR|nr:PREDICTED: FK506-binding protein 5 isoform X2 [Drosophila arizonae]